MKARLLSLLIVGAVVVAAVAPYIRQPTELEQDRLSSIKTSANKRLYFPRITVRLGVAALLALLLQIIAVKAPLGDAGTLRRVLMISSYVLLLTFVAVNLRRPGIAIIGAGLLLNFAAIVANSGMMAITPETVLRTGALPGDAVIGEWLPGTKDVLLVRQDVHLWFLTDRLVWEPISSVIRAFSVGDVIIAAGLIITLADLFLPRLRREPGGSADGAPASPLEDLPSI